MAWPPLELCFSQSFLQHSSARGLFSLLHNYLLLLLQVQLLWHGMDQPLGLGLPGRDQPSLPCALWALPGCPVPRVPVLGQTPAPGWDGWEWEAEGIPKVFLARGFGSVLPGEGLASAQGHLPWSQGPLRARAQCQCGWAELAPAAAALRCRGHSEPGINYNELNETCSSGCSGLVTHCEGGQVRVGAGGNEV